MEKVIRATRLAQGRPVLSLASHAKSPVVAAPERISPGVAEPPPVRQQEFDAEALKRTIEKELRQSLAEESRRAAAQALEAARKEGMAAGLKEGRELAAAQAKAELEASRERTAAVLRQMRTAHDEALREWKQDIAELAFAALCRVLRQDLVSAQAVMAVVENVCRAAGEEAGIVLRMHPRDIETLGADGAELALPNGTHVRLAADVSAGPGGCIAQTSRGTFDGSLQTQLRLLHAALCGDPEQFGPEGAAR